MLAVLRTNGSSPDLAPGPVGPKEALVQGRCVKRSEDEAQ
jgi:hypothetical protein